MTPSLPLMVDSLSSEILGSSMTNWPLTDGPRACPCLLGCGAAALDGDMRLLLRRRWPAGLMGSISMLSAEDVEATAAIIVGASDTVALLGRLAVVMAQSADETDDELSTLGAIRSVVVDKVVCAWAGTAQAVGSMGERVVCSPWVAAESRGEADGAALATSASTGSMRHAESGVERGGRERDGGGGEGEGEDEGIVHAAACRRNDFIWEIGLS